MYVMCTGHTKSEYIALVSARITEVVHTDVARHRHVVSVELLSKIRELDGVLDEDCVML